MTKPRSKMPIESFGSELFNALIEGSKRRIELKLSYRGAITLRMRLHQLRSRMREDAHPLYSIAAKTRISIIWDSTADIITNAKKVHFPKDPQTPATLILAPHDSEYADAFKNAGLTLKPIDHSLFTPQSPEATEDEPVPTLEDLLKDFK